MSEILVTAFEDEKGNVRATVIRIDRSKSSIDEAVEALQPDGSWKPAGLHDKANGFKLSNAEVKKE